MKTKSYTMEPVTVNRNHPQSRVPVSDPHRLKKLQEENNRLEKLVAELLLDNKLLRELSLSYW